MRIAITGASGFIGRHVLAELLQQDASIVAMTRDPGKLAGLDDRIEVVQLDIAEPSADAYDRCGRPDVMIHLAWDGLPNYQSAHHIASELPRQYRFLESMIQAGLPSLLVSGTCFEYGMHSGALAETTPAQPDNAYGRAKDALRKQLALLQASNPFVLTWTRLFYMIGPGQPGTSLYPQLEAAVAKGERVFNMSGGAQLRDYLPVQEVARSIVRLARMQGNFGVVNVCSGKPVTVKHLVEQWIARNQWQIALGLGAYPYPAHEPMEFWGDRSKLDTLLGTA